MRQKALQVIRKVQTNDENACSILITCKKATQDGKMSVELTYEGDPILASYLLENAQGVISLEEDRLN